MATHLFIALPLMVACGGKKAAPAAAAEPVAQVAAAATGDYPGDAKSKAFLSALTSMTVKNFAAVDGGGARVILTKLDFDANNSWSATGYVDAGEERMECQESGSWTMEPAESVTVATINWIIGQTDCTGREGGTETRAKITIVGDDIEVAFR